jgi:hypothetical protein
MGYIEDENIDGEYQADKIKNSGKARHILLNKARSLKAKAAQKRREADKLMQEALDLIKQAEKLKN